MGILDEFKEFAFEGNVLDMAIGIVLGVAFGDVVSSFVSDILSPPLGLLFGTDDLGSLTFTLGDGAVIRYGRFLAVLLQFALIAVALFLVVRSVNRIRREPEPSTPSKRTCPSCRTEIAREATRCPACTTELEPT